MGTLVFAIVGKHDLVYETEFSSSGGSSVAVAAGSDPNVGAKTSSESAHLYQFVMHSALDMVEERMWETTNMYLRTVDDFNDMHVYAWVTASSAKFLLLHEQKTEDGHRIRASHRNEESIKLFFSEINELYSKMVLNPFYNQDQPITSTVFHERVHSLGRKLL
uniref:Trafficking protein particle complex subunit n=1 Tax=Aplanochytrium stocchinoi TaxID=215587 RepID=A0A7S3PQB4_9STRA|mmetsp:Transcript_15772/g.19558  ORF Transcript_15772/g.19558 Transcript_15772/m.19558 type:complete len:163 (-) Transcript_15772:891-1379(-)|eukprot:CAMPEP_0204825440 /NCGR_PEP_ID=MMETSP1346-20131115/3329_1 /ASSEMBLY_ACC=CAM_ASM_000771 /TAXON_ID=215587 /ORGANISM="Aplanochytrium stocchinoi, Strain GSBS06" /LENGTH=162 /DNA_ID=CAMNT_0051953077 /DNA_START=489 /DNA_END=977 /DNA_ORIENTATION=+